ncbi:MAG: GNAT family N-acetyltransferase [Candidatus Pacebacteria bacterium]|nr:GNAT family N-acetyltransferase [Candidatus Paceibacterota bacterium]
MKIAPLRWHETKHFARLRNQIDTETKHLVARGGERKEDGLRVLARILMNRRLITLVARDNDEMIGYVSVVFAKFKKLKGNSYLTISVRASHRGKGVGSLLMQAAEELARERGARRMELEVFSQNPAVNLYKRLGYEEEGRKRKAVEDNGEFDDIIFMAKFL